MDLDLKLEKQLLPVKLSRRWMLLLAGLALLPSLVYGMLHLLLPEVGDTWYQWTASVQAGGAVLTLLVAILAFTHFHRVGDMTTPVIAIGLLCVGAMDFLQMWNALAMGAGNASGLDEIERQKIELAFSVSRGFFAFVMMSAAAFTPLRDRVSSEQARMQGLRQVFIFTGVFLVISLALMGACYEADTILAWVYGSSTLRWIMLLLPIGLYALAGLYVIPMHIRWHGRVFGQVILVSVISFALAQMHLILDDGQLGSQFFIACVASVVGYFIPFLGLMADYWKVYARLQTFYRTLQDRMLLFEQTRQVSERGNELFQQLMRHAQRPMLVIDSSHRITQMTNQLALDLGLSLGTKALPQLALTRPTEKLLGTEATKVLEPFFTQADERKEPVVLDTSLPIEKVEHLRALKWTLIPVMDKEGRVVAYLLVGYNES